MDNKKIIFYAPVGNGVPDYKLGGGEKGCRRTRELLTNAGYEVITVDKATMNGGAFAYLKAAVMALTSVKNLLKNNPNALLYVVGFYEKNLPLEKMILSQGKGHKAIYEARNGRLVKAYQEKGGVYKKLMDSVLLKADVIFAQGLEYVEFIKEKYGKDAVYTPNYVLNRSLKPYGGDRSFDTIRLLYFGRVSESKNVDVILNTAAFVKENGYPVHVTVIGGYTDEYKKQLDAVMMKANLSNDEVSFLGQQPFEVISDELQKAHFFVFPSQEKMEGHSNSLTEAMTFGVVPVVSTAGFNASIVGNKELVVEQIDAKEFAGVVLKVLKESTWSKYSKAVYERVKENYTEDRVRKNILGALARL